jgi:hypothetical protein
MPGTYQSKTINISILMRHENYLRMKLKKKKFEKKTLSFY